jgi:MFS family permease
MLLLPITMAVMGVSLLITVVPLMYKHFKDVPHFDYLIQGGVMTMPAIWVVLFSPVAGWLADRFGRRRILIAAMSVYAGIGIAPAFLDISTRSYSPVWASAGGADDDRQRWSADRHLSSTGAPQGCQLAGWWLSIFF